MCLKQSVTLNMVKSVKCKLFQPYWTQFREPYPSDQHLVVEWDKSISRLGARAPAVSISETFDSDNFSCVLSEGAVDAAYDQILGSIKQSEIVAKPRRAKPWFDGECLVLKRALRASYRVIINYVYNLNRYLD